MKFQQTTCGYMFWIDHQMLDIGVYVYTNNMHIVFEASQRHKVLVTPYCLGVQHYPRYRTPNKNHEKHGFVIAFLLKIMYLEKLKYLIIKNGEGTNCLVVAACSWFRRSAEMATALDTATYQC
jgi:hypothetical protein